MAMLERVFADKELSNIYDNLFPLSGDVFKFMDPLYAVVERDESAPYKAFDELMRTVQLSASTIFSMFMALMKAKEDEAVWRVRAVQLCGQWPENVDVNSASEPCRNAVEFWRRARERAVAAANAISARLKVSVSPDQPNTIEAALLRLVEGLNVTTYKAAAIVALNATGMNFELMGKAADRERAMSMLVGQPEANQQAAEQPQQNGRWQAVKEALRRMAGTRVLQ